MKYWLGGMILIVVAAAVWYVLATRSPGVEKAACLAAASKSVQKLATTTAKMVGKCRASINKGKVAGDPYKNCATDDEKTAAKIEATAQAVRETVAATCSLGELAELDLCGLGIGGITSVTEAQECLVALGREVGDSSEVPASRLFAPVSIIEAAYPPRPVCGDGAINQIPNPFLLLGEECDGDDDAACPGLCLPPGDLFECTCGDRPRVRAFAST